MRKDVQQHVEDAERHTVVFGDITLDPHKLGLRTFALLTLLEHRSLIFRNRVFPANIRI